MRDETHLLVLSVDGGSLDQLGFDFLDGVLSVRELWTDGLLALLRLCLRARTSRTGLAWR